MQHVDNDSSTLTEEVWQEVVQQGQQRLRRHGVRAGYLAFSTHWPPLWHPAPALGPARITVSCSLQRSGTDIPTSTSR